MDDVSADILSRVRKLLALANDAGASEGERDNAMRMAHATLAKHNLSMAEAEVAGTASEEQRVQDGSLMTRNMPWMRQCAYAVAQLFFCAYCYYPDSCRQAKHIFIGKQSNAETARAIAEFVINNIFREANKRLLATRRGPWWTSFCKGATQRIRERCCQLRKQAEAANNGSPSTGTSLVLASLYQREQQANTELMAQLFGKLQNCVNSGRRTSYAGYDAGAQYGDSVSLNRQVGTTPERTKLK